MTELYGSLAKKHDGTYCAYTVPMCDECAYCGDRGIVVAKPKSADVLSRVGKSELEPVPRCLSNFAPLNNASRGEERFALLKRRDCY